MGKSPFGLTGRSALVTGSGSGIGAAVADALATADAAAPRNNILVNTLARLAATQMTESIRTNEEFAANMMARISLKRWAEPGEVAGAFVFLASDASITGQVLPVDGGMVM